LFPYKPTTPKGVVFFLTIFTSVIHNVVWHLSYTHRCLDTGEYGLANSNLKIRFHVRDFIVWQTLSYKPSWVPDGKIVVWQIRIWYSISTDIIGYAEQVLVTDQEPSGFVIHAKQYGEWRNRWRGLVLHLT
jgi:hypothetical protein